MDSPLTEGHIGSLVTPDIGPPWIMYCNVPEDPLGHYQKISNQLQGHHNLDTTFYNLCIW